METRRRESEEGTSEMNDEEGKITDGEETRSCEIRGKGVVTEVEIRDEVTQTSECRRGRNFEEGETSDNGGAWRDGKAIDEGETRSDEELSKND